MLTKMLSINLIHIIKLYYLILSQHFFLELLPIKSIYSKIKLNKDILDSYFNFFFIWYKSCNIYWKYISCFILHFKISIILFFCIISIFLTIVYYISLIIAKSSNICTVKRKLVIFWTINLWTIKCLSSLI